MDFSKLVGIQKFEWENELYPELRILTNNATVKITATKNVAATEVAIDATFNIYLYQPASDYWEKKNKNHVPRMEFTSPEISCVMENGEILIDGAYIPNEKDYDTIIRLLGHNIIQKGFQWGVD